MRPTYLRNKHPGEQAGYLWRGPDGAPAGYVVVGPDGTAGWRNKALLGDNHRGFERLLWHDESAGDPEARLGALGQLARRWGCPEVAFDRLHSLSPLGRRLRRGRVRIEQEYRRYVVRVVNLPSLFEKPAPELGRRLAASPLAGWSGDLEIAAWDERPIREHRRVRTGRSTGLQLTSPDTAVRLPGLIRAPAAPLCGGDRGRAWQRVSVR